jgi:hypothetical protein
MRQPNATVAAPVAGSTDRTTNALSIPRYVEAVARVAIGGKIEQVASPDGFQFAGFYAFWFGPI